MIRGNLQIWLTLLLGIWYPSTVRAALVPALGCYSVSRDNQLYDLSKYYGKEFEFEQGEKTYVLRFCKDFQERSQAGYVSFGAYQSGPALKSTPAIANFINEYRHGDLKGCEDNGAEFNGRETTVVVICGSCPGQGRCKDADGCICSVTLESNSKGCIGNVVLALACPEPGPKVVQGFTVGFSPRGKEVINNGFTQWGYQYGNRFDYSFETSQTKIFLYFTAPSGVAVKIGKPTFLVYPSKGLSVKLSGTAAAGTPPTTLSPTVLEVDWLCEAEDAFNVTIAVPFEGFEPVEFSLIKHCARKQAETQAGSSGWATFGIFSCFLIVTITLCCCGGILYKTRVERKRGLEALPGVVLLANCLDMLSTDGGAGYVRADGTTTIIGEHRPLRDGGNGTSRAGGLDGKYGAV